jgi:hypothetical protein
MNLKAKSRTVGQGQSRHKLAERIHVTVQRITGGNNELAGFDPISNVGRIHESNLSNFPLQTAQA